MVLLSHFRDRQWPMAKEEFIMCAVIEANEYATTTSRRSGREFGLYERVLLQRNIEEALERAITTGTVTKERAASLKKLFIVQLDKMCEAVTMMKNQGPAAS
ncbi:hypothetical protein DL546_003434 [Coniochaeta pulveracea]|uniref:Uncharacterized protein n=1 Tax=Coniochaeta pulveracea TaxID=177199 RepID=A0A420YJL8_9PEZI|nr:hypothetical protein DL546_003434 [Coniochaeta pulveracea]